MNTRRHPYFATAFACLVTASTVIMGTPFLAAELGGAVADDDDEDEDDNTSLSLPQEIGQDDGTREIVVNLEPAKTSHGTDREFTVNALQAHADWTQRHVIEWAEKREGVEIKNRFWLANAVLLEVDTGQVDIDSIPGDHLRNIHPNYDINLYEGGAPAATGSTERAVEPTTGANERVTTGANERASTATGQAADTAAGRTADTATGRTADTAAGRTADTAAGRIADTAAGRIADTTTDRSNDSTASPTADAEDVTYGLDRLNAPTVWDEYDTRGEGVDVAVLDTGVDPDHPDIDIDPGNWAHFDRSGNRKGTSPQDGNGHGTHTSGTVTGSADPDGNVPAFGVAPDATLHHGKVLTDRGGGNFARIIAGMEWAIQQDVDIISMSLGVGGTAPELIEPSENARDAGVLVVASAGNSGDGSSGTPGNIPVNLAVGASNENDGIARFSSGEHLDTESAWGSDAPEHWPDEYVVPDVAAPGVDVLSATPGGGYAEKSGTSMAAPHVAGAAALIMSATTVDRDGAEDALQAAAEKPDDWDEPDDERDTRYGFGVIDASAAVEHAAEEHGTARADGAADTNTDAWQPTTTHRSIAVDAPEEFDRNPKSHRRRIDGEDTGMVGTPA